MQNQLNRLPKIMQDLAALPEDVQKQLLEGLKLPGSNPYRQPMPLQRAPQRPFKRPGQRPIMDRPNATPQQRMRSLGGVLGALRREQ